MADDTPQTSAPPQVSFKAALLTMNPKIVLAFFLVVVAALMVVFLIKTLTSGKATLDAGTIALFASFVTMFIKMAADGTGYQFSSSSGSDKKDETQARVADKLAEKVPLAPTPPPAPAAAPTPDQLGESMLSNGELAYFRALTDQEAKKAFLAMSTAERQATVAKG